MIVRKSTEHHFCFILSDTELQLLDRDTNDPKRFNVNTPEDVIREVLETKLEELELRFEK